MLVKEGQRLEVASLNGGKASRISPCTTELVKASECLHVPKGSSHQRDLLLHPLRPSNASPVEALYRVNPVQLDRFEHV